MNDIHIVVIDNGDTEPELWAFQSIDKATDFSELRGGSVVSIGVLDNAAADGVIENERAGI